MKNKLKKYMLVALLTVLPPVNIIWNGSEYLMVIYEDDYEALSEQEKKILQDVFAPAKLTLKQRPWTFN